MDFEFDNEIDVLLRQARKGETVFTATNPQSAHLDADEISAFAENALPEKAKQTYTAHLADCDSCRKTLSELIFPNAENEIVPSPENVIVASPTIPWYQRLFALPNLAYTMGALIVLFGGIIGFTVLQNFNSSQTSEVAKVSENQQSVKQMSSENVAELSESSSSANTNMAANTSVGTIYPSNSMMSNAPMNSNMIVTPNKPAPSLAEPKKDESRSENDLAAANKQGEKFSLDGVEEEQNKSSTMDGVAADSSAERKKSVDQERLTVKMKAKSESAITNRQVSELPASGRRSAELQLSPAAKSDLKKAKNSDTAGNEAAIVGGKTFDRRNNVWYDADYKQQSTINITRGTEKYKKLDKGLRTIVENLGGTVVVVWKNKAYRMQ